MQEETSKIISQQFPKSAHMRTPAEFDRVYNTKIYAADNVLVINAAANQMDCTRLGLSVSRKVGGAVMRNRWKRLIREVFRKQRTNLPAGLDLVVRPKLGAELSYVAIAESLPKLVAKIARRLSQQKEEDRRP